MRSERAGLVWSREVFDPTYPLSVSRARPKIGEDEKRRRFAATEMRKGTAAVVSGQDLTSDVSVGSAKPDKTAR